MIVFNVKYNENGKSEYYSPKVLEDDINKYGVIENVSLFLNKTFENFTIKSNAQKLVPILTVVIVSLLVVLTCVLIAYYQMYSSSKQNANVLEGVYASSYYSMVAYIKDYF